MITEIQLKGQHHKKIGKFSRLVSQLSGRKLSERIRTAHKNGFNPRLNRTTGELVGYTCRNCGKEYQTSGWTKRHTC